MCVRIHVFIYVCIYVYDHHLKQSMNQPDKVANPVSRVRLNLVLDVVEIPLYNSITVQLY